MKITVQKFGGSSLQTEERRDRCAEHVITALRDGYKVVVVVSAIGRNGDPYATDTLLNLVGGSLPNISKKEQDLLMSCGETISSVVFSSLLQSKGISSYAMTGAEAGFRISESYGDARILNIKTENIETVLQTYDVIVVTGFQGETPKGTVATLGRGGSDTSATALGAALKASYVDIFTDVSGIMTADPRIVKSAKSMETATYGEVSNMAYQGAKVIHPRAVEIAMQADVPIRIRSSQEEGFGTLIASSTSAIRGRDLDEKPVSAITQVKDISQLKISHPESQGDIFKIMTEAELSVDFISIHPDFLTFTIPAARREEACKSLQAAGYEVTWTDRCAKVAVVGAGMSGVPGVAAKIVSALNEKNIPIMQSADSHTTIWVLVAESDMLEAVNVLHEAFLAE
ncbi:aspartate kinase [Alkalicoccus daliensis]|uniref:Aspartokinase n=1 Tax=Alkalicoccus daliensis TaxID=745820 RepID=A0A1H0A7S0_9BACI|nr:aspartate kinase [Alkalicoccus daliensis]SDN29709.1 aspartate kinase [Alkalicoccus daliensis]